MVSHVTQSANLFFFCCFLLFFFLCVFVQLNVFARKATPEPVWKGAEEGWRWVGWGMEAREEQETEDTSKERGIEEGLALG